jgi:hypothetical protein
MGKRRYVNSPDSPSSPFRSWKFSESRSCALMMCVMLFARSVSSDAAARMFPMKNVPPPGRRKMGETSS